MVDRAWRRKFGLDQVQRLLAHSPQPDGLDKLRSQLVPEQRLDLEADSGIRYPMLFFWPSRVDGLAETFERLSHVIEADGAIWVIFPKKAHLQSSDVDMDWEQMQEAALTTDLVDNKVASFSDTHYGTRFVLRKDTRHRYQAT